MNFSLKLVLLITEIDYKVNTPYIIPFFASCCVSKNVFERCLQPIPTFRNIIFKECYFAYSLNTHTKIGKLLH